MSSTPHAAPANKFTSQALADYQKAVHNPYLHLTIWLVWAGVEAVIGNGLAFLLDWNKLLLATTWTTVGITALGGVLHALMTFAIARGNTLAAQLLAELEQEVLSRHGITADMIPMFKQLALSIAPDMLSAVEGKTPLPDVPRFPGQPPDIALPTKPPASPGVLTPTSSGGPRVGSNTAAGWAYQPPGQG